MYKRQRESIENRGNKLWHGSRFILPEHRDAMLEADRREALIDRSTLSEDKLEEINLILGEALHRGSIVTISVYDPRGIERISIVPKRIDTYTKTLKGVSPLGERTVSVSLDDILDVEIGC